MDPSPFAASPASPPLLIRAGLALSQAWTEQSLDSGALVRVNERARRGKERIERDARTDRPLPLLRAGQRVPAHAAPSARPRRRPARKLVRLPGVRPQGNARCATLQLRLREVPGDGPHRHPLPHHGRISEKFADRPATSRRPLSWRSRAIGTSEPSIAPAAKRRNMKARGVSPG